MTRKFILGAKSILALGGVALAGFVLRGAKADPGQQDIQGTWSANGKTSTGDPYSSQISVTKSTDGSYQVHFDYGLKDGQHLQANAPATVEGNSLSFNADVARSGLAQALSFGLIPAQEAVLKGNYTFDGSSTLQGHWSLQDLSGDDSAHRAGTGWHESYMHQTTDKDGHTVYTNGGTQQEEQKIDAALAQRVNGLQQTTADKSGQPLERGFHNKGKGAKATFTVSGSIAPDLQVGFMHAGASYDAIVRFSNAGSTNVSDAAPDQRGLAIRVDTKNPTQLLSGSYGPWQDWLTTNSDVTTPNPAEFMDFGVALSQASDNTIPLETRLGNIWALIKKYGFPHSAYVIQQLSKGTQIAPKSYTTEKFWSSRAPIAWGSIAVKFMFTPEGTSPPKPSLADKIENPELFVTQFVADLAKGAQKIENAADHVEDAVTDPNYLQTDLAEKLKAGPVKLQMWIQRYQSDATTPIEDGSVEWTTTPELVGELTIVEQDLDSDDAKKATDTIEKDAFSPWNTAKGPSYGNGVQGPFQPLGSLMRARKVVYSQSATYRGACPFGFGGNSSSNQ